MPLVSMKEMRLKGNKEGYAQAILEAAEKEQLPVILGVSGGAVRYMGGYKGAVAIMKLVKWVNLFRQVVHSSLKECMKNV